MRSLAAILVAASAALTGCIDRLVPSDRPGGTALGDGQTPAAEGTAPLVMAPVPKVKPVPPEATAGMARPGGDGGEVDGDGSPDGVVPHLLDPQNLVGLDEKETTRLLGAPSWTEDVPPAKYWQYATDQCVLRVFFFMEMTTQDFRALSYEMTSSSDAPDVDQRCFADLLAQASDRDSVD